MNQNNQNSNWKKLLGLRNMQENFSYDPLASVKSHHALPEFSRQSNHYIGKNYWNLKTYRKSQKKPFNICDDCSIHWIYCNQKLKTKKNCCRHFDFVLHFKKDDKKTFFLVLANKKSIKKSSNFHLHQKKYFRFLVFSFSLSNEKNILDKNL